MASAASVASDTYRLEEALARAGLPFALESHGEPARYSAHVLQTAPAEPLRVEFVLWPLGTHRLLWRLLRRRGLSANPDEWGGDDMDVLTVALGSRSMKRRTPHSSSRSG